MAVSPKINRREHILQCLAQMLETNPGQRITTAKLASEVGVSEAALYRHFPSKARMFEGLIEFIEESLLSRINLIMDDEKDTMKRCQLVLQLLLIFAERNQGFPASSMVMLCSEKTNACAAALVIYLPKLKPS